MSAIVSTYLWNDEEKKYRNYLPEKKRRKILSDKKSNLLTFLESFKVEQLYLEVLENVQLQEKPLNFPKKLLI